MAVNVDAAGAGPRADRGVAAGRRARGTAGGPLLIAADQEGGQLNALGAEATQFAGNMALGAVDDEGLTERVGVRHRARGAGAWRQRRLRPGPRPRVEPGNSALGIRSFGDDPAAVGRHGAAMVRGLQSAGVAASAKHFPGLGALAEDTHHALGVVQGSADDLDAHELAPFRAAIAAGARLVMSAHVAVPALTGDPTLPATLSRTVMGGTLRDGSRLPRADDQRRARHARAGPGSGPGGRGHRGDPRRDRPAPVRAGPAAPSAGSRRRSARPPRAACSNADELEASSARLADLRSWLAAAGPPPDLDVVGLRRAPAPSRASSPSGR